MSLFRRCSALRSAGAYHFLSPFKLRPIIEHFIISNYSQNCNLKEYILIEDLMVHSYHGDIPAERKHGQKFLISMKLFIDLSICSSSDKLCDTIDYISACKIIVDIAGRKPSYDMLERLADEILKTMFKKYESTKLTSIQIEIHKPQVHIPYVVKYVGISIFRSKEDYL